MTVIDKILREWSFRCHDGIVDMDDPIKTDILDKLLMELSSGQTYNPLTFYDLKKRGGFRFKILADKIKNKEPFSLVQGSPTILTFIDPQYQTAFASADDSQIKSFTNNKNVNLFNFFEDAQGEEYAISDLLKDNKFGGKGTGSGTVVEDYNLKLLNDNIETLKQKGGTSSISVIVNGVKYDGIVGAKTQKGTPKADFYLVRLKNRQVSSNNEEPLSDEDLEPVVWISHKKAGGAGPSADDFIRWSGYTMYAEDPEVIAFNTALENFLQKNNLSGIPNKTRFIAPIKNEELIRKLIYGPNYGGEYSKDNVNIILQGEIYLKPKDSNTYELSAEHVLAPPNIPNKDSDYYPYLTSSYRADREMFDIPNNEAIAMTKSVANKASNVYELDKQGQFIKIK
jgi:hypothetical protein